MSAHSSIDTTTRGHECINQRKESNLSILFFFATMSAHFSSRAKELQAVELYLKWMELNHHKWYSRPNTNGITTSLISSLFQPLPSAIAASVGWIAKESRLTCSGTGEFMLSSGKVVPDFPTNLCRREGRGDRISSLTTYSIL
ncbi:hypothetical protein AMTR_s00012p00227950 [Amborella trichopoda]|uniref:Uncharacterized protein n=1 Tax=Amborella trichopoda TaxID=13333 RepID=W1PL76_AMBTC|nr:hypothetical protein AMTR_s00012p00227950 [Amborella trichopoda]